MRVSAYPGIYRFDNEFIRPQCKCFRLGRHRFRIRQNDNRRVLEALHILSAAQYFKAVDPRHDQIPAAPDHGEGSDAIDLVLLDLMMPGLAGEEVLKRIEGIPVIVVSARADVEDKVELLLGGAGGLCD